MVQLSFILDPTTKEFIPMLNEEKLSLLKEAIKQHNVNIIPKSLGNSQQDVAAKVKNSNYHFY